MSGVPPGDRSRNQEPSGDAWSPSSVHPCCADGLLRPERGVVTLSSVTESDRHVKGNAAICPESAPDSPEWPFRIRRSALHWPGICRVVKGVTIYGKNPDGHAR